MLFYYVLARVGRYLVRVYLHGSHTLPNKLHLFQAYNRYVTYEKAIFKMGVACWSRGADFSDCDWVEKCNRMVMRNKMVQVQSSAIYDSGNMDENVSCY